MKKIGMVLALLGILFLEGCALNNQTETQLSKVQTEPCVVKESGELEKTEPETELEDGKLEETSPEGTRPHPEKSRKDAMLLDMENILQNPELPTGCESVALTMVLNYLGFELEKTDIADEYLIFDDENFAAGYMGNPYTQEGAGIFPPGLVNTANRFLEEKGSKKRAFDLSGTDFEKLYDYVEEKMPVIVWNGMYMEEPRPTSEICEYEGKQYQWFVNEHCVVLCGFDREENKVFVQDPLEGLTERDLEAFEHNYNVLGKYAMVIH